MNWSHVHLALNHLPVLGTLFGLLFSFTALVTKSQDLKKWSLWFVVFISAFAVPVYFTGEPAEKLVEHLPGVTEALIERHEDAALVGTIAAAVMGLLALFGIFQRIWLAGKNQRVFPVIVAANFAVALTFAWVANLGGQIHHPEIRDQTTTVSNPEATGKSVDDD